MKKHNYINSQQELKLLIEKIKKFKMMAIDTEFVREKTYFPLLSLIQIAIQNEENIEVFLIDCLAEINLLEIVKLIYDQKIIKIFHSSMQDLQIFQRIHNDMNAEDKSKLPENIFDTQIMSNIVDSNINQSYQSLVEKFCNYKINKNQQRSDWGRRPLTVEQLEYAVEDVLFLIPVYQELLQNITKLGRQNWLQEDLSNLVATACSDEIDHLFRKICPRDCGYQQKNHMNQFLLWREELVKIINLPRQHFVEDEIITKIINYNASFGEEIEREELQEDMKANHPDFENKESNSQARNQEVNLVDIDFVPNIEVVESYFIKKIVSDISNRIIATVNVDTIIKMLQLRSNDIINEQKIYQLQSEKRLLFNYISDFISSSIATILNTRPSYTDILHIKKNESVRLNNDQKKTLQNIQKLVAKIAQDYNISGQFLINSYILKKIISQPNNLNIHLSGWRQDLLSEPIATIINAESL